MIKFTLVQADDQSNDKEIKVKWKVFRTVVDKERYGLQRHEDPHGYKKEAVKEAAQ